MSEVGRTIIEQMGGYARLRVMVAARDFVYSDNSVQFSFSGAVGVNKCRVVYHYDLYTFELWHYNKYTLECVQVYSLEGVYFDMLIDLFESKTGLYLRIY